MAEEFLTGDYAKVFDMLDLTKEEFLETYNYIDEESYKLSLAMLKQVDYLANLFRQTENLYELESDVGLDREEIDYMQEEGTDYISSSDWRWAIMQFIAREYTPEMFSDFNECIGSMGI